jgi:hypothetical protein
LARDAAGNVYATRKFQNSGRLQPRCRLLGPDEQRGHQCIRGQANRQQGLFLGSIIRRRRKRFRGRYGGGGRGGTCTSLGNYQGTADFDPDPARGRVTHQCGRPRLIPGQATAELTFFDSSRQGRPPRRPTRLMGPSGDMRRRPIHFYATLRRLSLGRRRGTGRSDCGPPSPLCPGGRPRRPVRPRRPRRGRRR